MAVTGLVKPLIFENINMLFALSAKIGESFICNKSDVDGRRSGGLLESSMTLISLFREQISAMSKKALMFASMLYLFFIDILSLSSASLFVA